MPVTAIGLRNFMAFRDSKWLELRKLTLLLGRNSSGKTSLIRALRLLKQSLETNDPDQPLQFVVDGGLDAGSFDAVIHRSPAEGPPIEHIAESHPEDGASSKASPRSAPEEIEPVEGVPEFQKKVEKIEWSEPLSFMFRGSVPLYSLEHRWRAQYS
jgi:predicted ATPase